MARPTTWRRGYGSTSFYGPSGTLDLALVQPGETLGGVWWQYQLRSVGGVAQNINTPLGNTICMVGLRLDPESVTPPSPLSDPLGDWLWWELATWDHLIVNTIDFAYVHWSNSGNNQRKAQGMRKVDGVENEILRVCWDTIPGDATAAETAFSVTAAASAVVILPG